MRLRSTLSSAFRFCCWFAAGVAGLPLAAQPSGGQVVAGAVAFSAGPGALTLQQSSARAIIEWQDFSLGAGATLRFVQPDATAATLNRVVSGLPSTLLGHLEANGRVFLINPNGVLIGAGARIDTAGFLASTLDVSDHAFLGEGDLVFAGGSAAAITNLGAINALGGDVFLIARHVENRGAITAAGRDVAVAAGSEILLTTGGQERLFVQAASLPGTIVNSGAISAASAALRAAGGNEFALAINNSGMVRATGSARRNGEIWLVATGDSTVTNSGTLDVSSAAQAGRAVVTGGRVLLDPTSKIDATGGGGVFVGGGWQGGDESIRNATAVVMQPGAIIDVSASGSGHAGTAVLWSQEYTGFFGEIAARGGVGNGGSVETSSLGNLQASGSVVTSSAGGPSGRWLLDPWDVTIVNTVASGTAFANVFTPTANSSILASSIEAALNAGADVSISTGTTGSASGIIHVNAPITWTGNSTLTLTAFTSVRINAPITATGATAGLVISPNTPSNMFGGIFSLNNRASITLSGATPSLKIGGLSYTVINRLGAEGDASTAPGSPSLQGLAAAANLSGRFALGSDLDASATSTWNAGAGFRPIGTPASPFKGTLEGLGHTVSGLTIVRPTEVNVGLFGYINGQGSVKHLGLLDVSVLGKSSVGGLVGYNVGGVQMSYVTGTVSGPGGHFFTSDRVGGLAGTNAGAIATSYSSATVSGTTNVGGLIGFNGENQSGGYNGYEITTLGTIQESYATGNVSGLTSVGGLVGTSDAYSDAETVSTIKYVYATGNVSGTTNVGGLVGNNKDTGLVEGYATGSVSGTTSVGGLAGRNEQTKPEPTTMSLGIYNSYWNTESTGQAAAVGSENGQTQFSFGRTTAEMKQRNSFSGFNNIANVGGSGAMWRIYEGQTTPWLMAFLYPYTVTASNDTRTYNAVSYAGGNGTTSSLALPNPGPAGTVAFGGTAQSAVNVGTYSIVPSGLYSLQQGTDISYVAGTLTINRANLTISGSRVYDGSTAFPGNQLIATGVAGQTFTVTGAGQAGNLNSKNVQTNQSLASVGGLSLGTSSNGGIANNYNPFFQAASSVSVTPASLTLSGTRVYDGTTLFAGSALMATGVAGETFTVTGAGAPGNLAGKNVQTNQTLASVAGLALGTGANGALASNYQALTFTGSSVSVTPAALTLTGTRVYDGTTTFAGGFLTASGVNGETFAVTGSGQAGNLATKNVQTGQLLASVGGLGVGASGNGGLASNYTALSTIGSSVSVTPRALTIAGFAANNKVYDGTTTAVIATPGTLTGVVTGDTVGFTHTGATFASKNVRTGATVTLNGVSLTGGDQTNYTYTAVTTELSDITPATLTYTANLANRIYGAANPALSGTVTGFVGGETLGTATTGTAIFTSTATPTTPVGNHAILGSGLTANNGNYNFVQAASNATALTINPAPLTVQADNKSRTAGAANPTLTASYSGFVNGETPALVSGLVLTTPAVPSSPAGNYPITPSGATAPNYTLTFVDGILSIDLNLLTITADDKTKLYGAGLPVFTASYAGLVNGDTPGIVTGLQFATTATASSNVGTFAITPFGATAAGYSLAYVPGTLTINPAALTIGVNDVSRTYGAANPAFTATYAGLVNGDTSSVVSGLTLATPATATSNVGSYAITPANGAAANYAITYTPGALSVTPAPLSVTAASVSRTYGGSNPAFSGTTTGFVNGETTAVITGLVFGTPATPASGVGSYAITPSGATAPNYTVSFVPGTLIINPAPLVITADNKSRAAGVANPAFTASYTGFVNGDTAAVVNGLTFATPATLASLAGDYPIVPGGATAANYTPSFVNGTLAIGSNLLTITADNKVKLYGAPLPAFTASYTGFVNGDTASVVTGLQFSTTATASSNVGTFAITPFGAAAAGYSLAYVPGTLTINPAALTIEANSAARAYGSANPPLTASFSGLVNGDTAAVVSGLAVATSATTTSGVGSYPITPAGGVAANYTINHVPGLLNVTPASLTIAATSTSRTYGAANPPFGGTITGFVNGENASIVSGVSFTSPATQGSNVGSYAITPSGATAPNYTIFNVPGTLTVNPAPLTITAMDAARPFGAPNPNFSATYAGFVNADTAAVVTGLTFSTPATTASVAGAYPIMPGGARAENYQIGFVPGTLKIAGQPLLTIRADDQTKLYGAPLPVFTATYTGLLAGDTPTSVTGLQFATTGLASSNVGTYTITPFGATSPTYSLAYVPGTLRINPAALTITAASATRTYGAPNPNFSASFAGLVNGDTSAVVSGLTLSTPATAGSAVGNYAITPANASAANYTVGYVPGVLDVTPAPLTITANNAARTYGGANPAFTGVFSGFVNGDTAAGVSGLVFSSPATSATGVGSYPIAPSGAVAPNYAVTFVPGTLVINRAALTLTADDATRFVGTGNPDFTGTFTGFVNGDTPAVVTGVRFTTPANAGSGPGDYQITPSGATAANYTLTFVDGTLRLIPPAVAVGATSLPVAVVNDQPAQTAAHAAVELDGRLALVKVGSASAPLSVDLELARTLAETTKPLGGDLRTPVTAGSDFGRFRTEGSNVGAFEFVSSFPAGNARPLPSNEPGLYRESAVNMGGFNVIYHEPVATAREQAQGNTALGSSYREFTEDENPQLNVVRAKVERKRPDPAASRNGGGRS